MVLDPDFRKFLRSLNKHKVRYLVVGGYAVALHGYPRYTKNLDVWIALSADNAARIMAALRDFGYDDVALTEDDFLEPGYVIRLGEPPSRIDMRTDMVALEFDTCWADRVELTVDGDVLPFIDLAHLKHNKQAVGSLQDLADLENLG